MRNRTRIGRRMLGGMIALSLVTVANQASALPMGPSIEASLSLTNQTQSTRSFPVRFSLPVSDFPGSSSRASGFIEWTLTDEDGDGAMFSDSGAPIYTAMIDGKAVRTLLDPAVSFSDAGVTHRQEFSGLTGMAVTSGIGIATQFNLSASDTLALRTGLEVVPVSAPATTALLGLGTLGLIGLRRRTG